MHLNHQPDRISAFSAKVSGKILLIDNLLSKFDEMTIGIVTRFAFKKVISRIDVGSSLLDGEGAKLVRDRIKAAKENGVKTDSLEDFVDANKFDEKLTCLTLLLQRFVRRLLLFLGCTSHVFCYKY